ncbi:MAG: SsrA-binding protein SmpB [Candidatus Pacebacteria bacterium]|nr:SsrA-binding protein SmpB [Candidatus Paceibacterota bacterium]
MTYADNKKAKFDYQILDEIEAGIVLKGFEVAAVKKKMVSLKGSYAYFHLGEMFLLNMHISPYQIKNMPKDYDPTRTRKLLLNKKELEKIYAKIKEMNFTLIPLKIYSKNDIIKVLIGICKGKKKYDKRETIKKREFERKILKNLK